MNITVPELALVTVIGASGSGKSTFCRAHFKSTEILSSDFFRGLVSDDENDQSVTKEAFETLREWTPGLGRPPVTITPTDHRPGPLVRIYIIKDKKFALLKEVDLKKRWPDKWEKEWLGW